MHVANLLDTDHTSSIRSDGDSRQAAKRIVRRKL